MSTRVSLTITNGTKEKVQCKHILCQDIDGMDVGDTLEAGATKTYTVSTNDRVFCDWVGMETGDVFKMGMTCPKSSHNSAAGYGNSGLQTYSRTGTPVSFTFNLGHKCLADWDNGDEYTGAEPTYGDCS